MKLPKSLISRVNDYYAFRSIGFQVQTKDECLKAIDVECVKYNISFCSSAGLMIFSKGKQRFETTKPIRIIK